MEQARKPDQTDDVYGYSMSFLSIDPATYGGEQGIFRQVARQLIAEEREQTEQSIWYAERHTDEHELAVQYARTSQSIEQIDHDADALLDKIIYHMGWLGLIIQPDSTGIPRNVVDTNGERVAFYGGLFATSVDGIRRHLENNHGWQIVASIDRR